MATPSRLRLPHAARELIALSLSTWLLAPFLAVTQRRSSPVVVRHVVDGDTIDILGVGRVQLLGIDAPEISRELDASARSAREARQRLAGLLTERWVRIEYEDGPGDPPRRRPAYVFLEDGQFVNAWVVREGLARVRAGQRLRRLSDLERAEAEAQASRRGIWRDCPSTKTKSPR
jgi:micrococcal nuclease